MFIETSLWALMLRRTNLQELKYGYRMDISLGGFPAPLHICSLVYNKSWQNHHSCSLHILNIHMTALYFASSPVYGFTCSRKKKTTNLQQWRGGGVGWCSLSVQKKQWCLSASGLKKLWFCNVASFEPKSAYWLLWVLTLSDYICIYQTCLEPGLWSFCFHFTGWNLVRLNSLR